MDVTFNAFGRFFAACHSLHHGLWTVEGVTTGEHPFQRRLQGDRICFQTTPSGYGDALFFTEAEISGLADGHNNRICVHAGELGFIILGIEGPFFVEHGGTLFELDA